MTTRFDTPLSAIHASLALRRPIFCLTDQPTGHAYYLALVQEHADPAADTAFTGYHVIALEGDDGSIYYVRGPIMLARLDEMGTAFITPVTSVPVLPPHRPRRPRARVYGSDQVFEDLLNYARELAAYQRSLSNHDSSRIHAQAAMEAVDNAGAAGLIAWHRIHLYLGNEVSNLGLTNLPEDYLTEVSTLREHQPSGPVTNPKPHRQLLITFITAGLDHLATVTS